jgi:hypothetical protein
VARSDKPISVQEAINRVLDYDNSRLQVDLSELPNAAALADAMSNPTTQGIAAHMMVWNGATWDRMVTHEAERVLLASAARTATTASAAQVNRGHMGLYILLDVTGNPGGAQTLTLKLRLITTTPSNQYVLMADAAQSFGGSTGKRLFIFHPTPGATGDDVDVVKTRVLPRDWDIQVVHSGSGSWTYSVTAYMLP